MYMDNIKIIVKKEKEYETFMLVMRIYSQDMRM